MKGQRWLLRAGLGCAAVYIGLDLVAYPGYSLRDQAISERVAIYGYLIWIAMLAIVLLRAQVVSRLHPSHEQASGAIAAPLQEVFAFLDDHERLASHMSKRSWMMGGGKMETTFDAGRGHAVGSVISMRGRVFGVAVSLDERILERDPPHRKVWETLGEPRLLVIGSYRMGFTLAAGQLTALRVWIDYALPDRGTSRVLGKLLGGWYARWCVRRMVTDATQFFAARQGMPHIQTG
jgi:hypothetical protein